jgi:hypothetical protein
MIQLRYVVGEEWLSEQVSRKTMKLQYRERNPQTMVHFVNDEDNWLDWRDVPEVSERDA